MKRSKPPKSNRKKKHKMEEDTESSGDIMMEELAEPDPPTLMPLRDNFSKFDVRKALQGEELEQAKQPYSGMFGESKNTMHDDLSKLSKTVMKCSSQTKSLDQQQIKAAGNNQIPMETWSKVTIDLMSNTPYIHAYIEADEAKRSMIIISRIAHTHPSLILPGYKDFKANPLPACKAWQAAILAIGSWYKSVPK